MRMTDIAFHHMRVQNESIRERVSAVVDIGDGTVGSVQVIAIRVSDDARKPHSWALTDKQIEQFSRMIETDIRRNGLSRVDC